MSNTANVYLHVIEDVIKNVRADFQSEGVDESVLHEFQALWELKLMQSGSLSAPVENIQAPPTMSRRPGLTGTDLNMPYELEDDYAAQLLSVAPTMMPNPRQTREPLQYQYNFQPVEDSRTPDLNIDPSLGRPDLFMMKPSQWDPVGHPQNIQRHPNPNPNPNPNPIMPPNNNSNMPIPAPITQDFFVGDRKRKRDNITYIPQADGCADTCDDNYSGSSFNMAKLKEKCRRDESQVSHANYGCLEDEIPHASPHSISLGLNPLSFIPQSDGDNDLNKDESDGEDDNEWVEGDGGNGEEEEEEEEEDYNAPRDPATPAAGALASSEGNAQTEEDNEPPLGADDDEDDLDDLKDGDDEPQTTNLVVSTYDKAVLVFPGDTIKE